MYVYLVFVCVVFLYFMMRKKRKEKVRRNWINFGGCLYINSRLEPGMTDEKYVYSLAKAMVNTCIMTN